MSLDRSLVNKVLSEFVGAFTLTAVVIVMAQTIGQPFLTGLAAALVLATFVTTIGSVSGAHLNPAVTLGFASLRKIKPSDAAAYIVFQLVGAFAATRFVEYMYGTALPGKNEQGKFNGKIFVAELVGTAVFTWGIAAVVNKKVEGYQAAAAIGTSLFLGVMLASMTQGAGFVNPAVAFGNHGLTLNTALAPIAGSIIAFNLVNILNSEAPVKLAPSRTVASRSTSRSSSRSRSTTKKKK